MTSVEEKIDAVKSGFAGGNIFGIHWNSLLLASEFVGLKKPFMSITWKRLS